MKNNEFLDIFTQNPSIATPDSAGKTTKQWNTDFTTSAQILDPCTRLIRAIHLALSAYKYMSPNIKIQVITTKK